VKFKLIEGGKTENSEHGLAQICRNEMMTRAHNIAVHGKPMYLVREQKPEDNWRTVFDVKE
jgi:hypothetical protein